MSDQNTKNQEIALYIDAARIVLPIGVELIKYAREEVAAGRARVELNREEALKLIDGTKSESWAELPVVGGGKAAA